MKSTKAAKRQFVRTLLKDTREQLLDKLWYRENQHNDSLHTIDVERKAQDEIRRAWTQLRDRNLVLEKAHGEVQELNTTLSLRLDEVRAERVGLQASNKELERQAVAYYDELKASKRIAEVAANNQEIAECKAIKLAMELEGQKAETKAADLEARTMTRLLKIIKATVNSMTLAGEDTLSYEGPDHQGLNG